MAAVWNADKQKAGGGGASATENVTDGHDHATSGKCGRQEYAAHKRYRYNLTKIKEFDHGDENRKRNR